MPLAVRAGLNYGHYGVGEVTAGPQIRRTCVHLGGYYPHAPDVAAQRFARDLAIFARTWSLAADMRPAEHLHSFSHWQVTTRAPDWTTLTDHYLFRWDDLIDADRARSWWTRLPLGLLAFIDFIVSGAATRYLFRAWRYFLFFLYPFLGLFLLIGAAAAMAQAVPLGGLPDGTAPLARLALATATLAVLLHSVGRWWMLDHLIDDWIYARRLLRQGDRALEARLDALADTLAAAAPQELLIAGHSLGACHGAALIERLQARGLATPVIGFASLGSSILKVGYHRSARALRATLARITGDNRLRWVDFQALNDPMNFYKREPMRELGLPGPPAHVRVVKFRTMLSKPIYRRVKRNFFRLHSQFIAANDLRARYDYQMMLHGPFPLSLWAHQETGLDGLLDNDSRLTEAGNSIHRPSRAGPPA